MIKFVTGTANLDISGRLCGEILSLLKNRGSELIVYIVPEQFEYASERKIYKLLKENDALSLSERVKVKTFSALALEVLDICSDTRPIADDIIKNVIVHKAVQGCAADLKAFGGICKRPGFSQKILSTIKGFKEIGLSADELAASLDRINKPGNELSDNTLLMNKLADASLLYSEYSVNMKDYLDAPDVTALAAKSLAGSGVLCGDDIIVDCFNDFTGGQMEFIQSMIPTANSVMFGFTTDYDSENDVFRSANDNINAIRGFAEREDIETEFIRDNIAPRSGLSAPVSELSLKIFSDKKSDVPPDGCIELISASDVHEELDFVCSKIIALADEKNYRFRDAAVLCTDLGTYGRYIESAFKKYNIPIFLDTHESILDQPLTNTVVSILRALENYSVDTVISCLKTGFFSKPAPKSDDEPGDRNESRRVGLTSFDINSFEEYVFEWAITTKHLMSPFKFPVHSGSTGVDYKKQAAETVRREVAVPLYKFSKKIPKNGINGAELTEMLYDFLMNDVGVKRALMSRTVDRGEEDEDVLFDKESIALYKRLWNALIQIFNALHKELDGVLISIKDYTEMFRDLCSGTTLSSPPQMADRVLVGDIDRTRADGIRAAFIVGATYDAFPTDFSQTGVFSEYEAELICSGISQIKDGGDIEIFKSARERFALAKYRAYKAMTLPTEYLCVTSPEMDAQGEATERSEVTYELSKMFTNGSDWRLEVSKASAYTNKPNSPAPEAEENAELDINKCLTNEFYCRSEQSAKARYALELGGDSHVDAVLEEALKRNNNAEFVETLKEIRTERGSDKIGEQTITHDQARLLFPTTISATQIEKLCKCPFSFFTGKGLNINERQTRVFNYITRGNAIHYILEKVLSAYSGDIDELCKLTRADFLRLSKQYLEEYCDLETNGDFNEDERSRFLFRNITHSASDVLISMQSEFFARGYRPKFFELELGKEPETLHIPDDPEKPSAPPPPAELYSGEESSVTAASAAPKEAVESSDTIRTAPFVIRVDDTLSVLVTGRIDRVDMYTAETDNNKKTYVRMVDYKSSAHAFSLGHAINGLNAQMLLYMLAIIDANRDNPINVTAGELSYISSKSSGASSKASAPFRLLAEKHLGSNMFVRDAELLSDLDEYREFIKKKVAGEDGKTELLAADPKTLSPEEKKEREEYEESLEKLLSALDQNADNSIDSKDFDTLRDALTEKLTQKLGDLFNGNVTAAPKAAAAGSSPCKYCNLQSICKNRSLAVEVVSKKDWTDRFKVPDKAKKDGAKSKKGEEE